MKKIYKILLSALALIVASIPFDFFLIIKNLLNPQGFWQRFAVYGVGVWFLGGLEFAFVILAIYVIFGIWTEFN